MAIGRAIVYYDLAAHAVSAGIKCRHCTASNAIAVAILLGRVKVYQ